KNEMTSKAIDQIDVSTDEDYLRSRFDLFLKYTVPSVNSQTRKEFEWLVLFSDQTPTHYRKEIEEIKNRCPHLSPIFLNSKINYKEFVTKYIKSKLDNKTPMNTTRLDNDDAIRNDFIQKIQKSVETLEEKDQVLIFPDGFQYEEKTGAIANYCFPENHFSTLICYGEEVNTILDYNHMEISKLYPTIFLEKSKAMWIEVIHDNNLLNRIYYTLENANNTVQDFRNFGLCISINKLSKVRQNLLILFNTPKNIWRLFKQYGIKKIGERMLKK